ncbi:hypothetical protein RRG08_031986 [Elysia crispata]|uniref:Uncharacterized protein n=1 Tax=Elysia crispata TaxID=231223 RepID=A0AAE1D9L6_9GAST|nr:hypothetical protein RRG08_031986 [Elysia crispata]
MFLRSGRVVVPREEPGLDAPAPNPDYQAPEILRNGRDLQGLGIDLQNPDRDAPAFPEDRQDSCYFSVISAATKSSRLQLLNSDLFLLLR